MTQRQARGSGGKAYEMTDRKKCTCGDAWDDGCCSVHRESSWTLVKVRECTVLDELRQVLAVAHEMTDQEK